MLRLITVFLVAACLCTIAVAQGDDDREPSPHGWVTIEDVVELPQRGARRGEVDLDDEPAGDVGDGSAESNAPSDGTSSVLLHLPPRVPVAGASPAPDLRVARIARLSQAPEFLVPVGSRVYAIMPADESGVHRVGRSRVYPRGLRDLWGADPARRLEVLPAIEASVVAASTDGDTPAVLVRRSADEDQTLGLLRFNGGGWVAHGGALRVDPDARFGLQWWGGRFHAVQLAGQGVTWHTLDGDAWVSHAVITESIPDPSSWRLVGSWRGEFVVLADDGEAGLSAIAVSQDRQRTLASLPDGEWSAMAILADPGRLVLVATSQEATEDASTALPSPGLRRRSVTVAEISLVTGALLAIGEATASSPVSRGEFQSLALLLVGAMIIVLVVVVRPSPTAAEPVLPPGTAIAPPGRRLVASIADLLPSIFVTSIMLDITVLETLGPIALPVTGSVDIVPLLVVLALSAAHSAGGEMLTGRSLGKALTGIFVARVDPMPGTSPEPGRFRPPTPGGAVLRNILKWFLFPATAIVLSDPSGRHRGDLFARSAVLLPVPPTE